LLSYDVLFVELLVQRLQFACACMCACTCVFVSVHVLVHVLAGECRWVRAWMHAYGVGQRSLLACARATTPSQNKH
jgi:hypothetical protein